MMTRGVIYGRGASRGRPGLGDKVTESQFIGVSAFGLQSSNKDAAGSVHNMWVK